VLLRSAHGPHPPVCPSEITDSRARSKGDCWTVPIAFILPHSFSLLYIYIYVWHKRD
jgi:hypothetical protein